VRIAVCTRSAVTNARTHHRLVKHSELPSLEAPMKTRFFGTAFSGSLLLAACAAPAGDTDLPTDEATRSGEAVSAAPISQLRPFGYNARSINVGYPAGNLQIPVLIAESSAKEMRFFSRDRWRNVWNSSLAHDGAYYEQLLFGPGFPNASDFFREESHGHFTITRAGHAKMIDLRGVDTKDGPYQRTIKERIGSPSYGDFDFRDFDKNHDGQVDDTELWIVNVNESGNGGANRPSDPSCADVTTRTGTIKVCSRIAHVGDTVGFDTLVHEMSHSLGALDLYGRWGIDRNFMDATLMSATIRSGRDDRSTLYHDVWHRFQFGWEQPALFDMTKRADTHGTHFLLPPSKWNGVGNTIIFGSSSSSRYLIAEYRRPEGYDRNIRSEGLYVWSIEQDENGDLKTDAAFRNYPMIYLGNEICQRGSLKNADGGLGACTTMGNWDNVVPVDGTWRQFYIPNTTATPRVRAWKNGDGVTVEWQSMFCTDGGCSPFNG
jgi:M6 family metalloprotease-like protein